MEDAIATTREAFRAYERELARLRAEVERLQGVEREAQRVLGAVVYYSGGGQVILNEETLLDEYAVERTRDVARMKVRLRAWPSERH